MTQNEIAEWITNQVEKYDNGVIKLRYVTTNKKKEQLEEWPLDLRTARAVARQAWNRAGNDATMFNEAPSYELVIGVKQDGKIKIKARYSFDVESSSVEDTKAIMGQATVGFMQQVFAHNEVLMRTLVQVVTAGEVAKLRELERLDQRNASLEQRLDVTREEVERSKDKNHERSLAKAKFDADEKRINDIVTTGRTMIPFVVNSIAKKNLLPTEGHSPLLAALNPIMESLTPEQFSKMHEILTPAQQVGLSELYKMAKGEEEDAKRRRKKNEVHR